MPTDSLEQSIFHSPLIDPVTLFDPNKIQLQWSPGDGKGIYGAIQDALPGAVVTNEHTEHPFTTMTIKTPQNETWNLVWLTGGIMASYSATMEKVEDAPKSGLSQPITTVNKQQYGQTLPEMKTVVRDSWDLYQLQAKLPIELKFDNIDYSKEMLLVLSAGQKGNPGHDITIESAEVVNGKLQVKYSEAKPKMGSAYMMVCVNPVHIVKTPQFNGPVEFVRIEK